MPNNVEIERKFLLEGFPEEFQCIEEATFMQGYLSLDPEVRIRRKYVPGKDATFKLTFKSSGSLSRKEIEISINFEQFEALWSFIDKSLITKKYKKYRLPDGHFLEVSLVDEGSADAFYYAEVEFESEEAAKAFEPSFAVIKDVTEDSSYKMKNYWRRTRLKGDES